jgi:hypothetical protein
MRSRGARAQIGLALICLATLPGRSQVPAAATRQEELLPGEQAEMITAMRTYAEKYVASLPNFTCLQVIQEFEAGKKSEHWHKRDKFAATLIFDDGHEERNLEMVNDRPVRNHRSKWWMPLTTEGEFGILLASVFGATTETEFKWAGWRTERDKRLAAFQYFVNREHSTLRLSLTEAEASVVAYQGWIYAEPYTGRVWRITSTAVDIPPKLRIQTIGTTVDYDDVTIGGSTFLLPQRASVVMATEARHIRNDMEFTDYRKFEAKSAITYKSDAENGKDPDNLEKH